MLPRKFRNPLLVLMLGQPVFSGVAATGTLGVQALSGFEKMDFGYNLSAYYKFDDQVLLGVQSGQGTAQDASAIPVLAAAYMRLPIGKVIVPVATGGLGYAFHTTASGFMWRAGAALDIRNGRHSSIVLGPEYEGHSRDGSGIVLRAGFLLEL